MYTRKI